MDQRKYEKVVQIAKYNKMLDEISELSKEIANQKEKRNDKRRN